VRAGIRSLLERAQDILVIAEAKDGIEALEIVKNSKTRCFILDMEMPSLNGNQVAEKLKEEGSPVQVSSL
jgi:YesN/AraC family two-component response regulator